MSLLLMQNLSEKKCTLTMFKAFFPFFEGRFIIQHRRKVKKTRSFFAQMLTTMREMFEPILVKKKHTLTS